MTSKLWKRLIRTLEGRRRAGNALAAAALALMLAGALATPSPAAADRLQPASNISLRDLGLGDVTVHGYQPTLTLWFPGYGDYEITEGNYLNLEYNHTEIINFRHSTVTVYLNGLPLTSRLLSEESVKRATWRIALPKDKLKRDVNKIELRFLLHGIDEDDCHGEEAKYATVFEETLIHYQYTSPLKFIPLPPPDLGLFPEPFLRPTVPGGVVGIVLPDRPSVADYGAAASVAARLGQVAGGKPMTVTLHLASDIRSVRNTRDLIVIGKPGANALLEEMNSALPLKYRRQGEQAAFVDGAGNAVDQSNGVLQLMISPWDQRFAVLVVSGGNDEGLRRAVRVLTSRLAAKALQGPYSIVTKASEELVRAETPGEREPLRISLRQLGLSDSVFDGIGSHTSGFSVDIPPLDQGREAYFDLDISYSPILSPYVSSVRVSVNGTPVWSKLLDSEHADRATYRVPLPHVALRPGVNSFKVQFDLYTRWIPECAPLAPERAWAVFYADSAVVIPASSARPALDLVNLPYPFVQNGTPAGAFLVLPDDKALLEDSLQVAVAFGRQSLGGSTEMQASLASQVTEEVKRGYDLIVYGLPEGNSILAEAQPKLPLTQEGGVERALQRPGTLLLGLKDVANLGHIQLIVSPWNNDRALLAISGTTPAMAKRAQLGLGSSLPTGNVALLSDELVKVAGIKMVGEIEKPAAQVPLHRRLYSVAAVPAALALLALVGLMLARPPRRQGDR